MWKLKLLLHKKSSSTTYSYTPSEGEQRMYDQMANYTDAVMPNALWLNDVARSLLEDSLGAVQVDYDDLLNQATNYSNEALSGVSALTTGQLPQEYLDNMTAAISSTVENTMGSAINDLGSRGVLNSSVTNTTMNDISKNVSNAVAENYLNNISTLNGLYGQESSMSGNNIYLASAAQEAAQTPALNLWNASLGLEGSTTSAASAMSGTGTTTTSTSGGSGLWGTLSGLASGYASSCFTEDTKVKTPDGEKFIRHINVGDEVISYNPETGKDEVAKVTAIMPTHYSSVYAVICTANDGKHFVSTTLTQPLMMADGEFICVDMLRIGTELKNGYKVQSVMLSGERKVHDLKVSGANTYYANGFVAKGGTTEW